jgi:hypothetical protein
MGDHLLETVDGEDNLFRPLWERPLGSEIADFLEVILGRAHDLDDMEGERGRRRYWVEHHQLHTIDETTETSFRVSSAALHVTLGEGRARR